MQSHLARVLSAVVGIGVGLGVVYYFGQPLLQVYPFFEPWVLIAGLITVPLVTGIIFFFIAPVLLQRVGYFIAWLEARVSGVPLMDILVGSTGLIVGLLIAALLGSSLARIPVFGSFLAIGLSLLLGYLGWAVAIKKRDDLVSILPLGRLRDRQRGAGRGMQQPKVLDTSAIIDGRIADTYAVGFLEGPIIIPQFVLDELQRIADSTDPLKRQRGRRGLDVLARLQKELHAEVEILPEDGGQGEVDARLVEVAKRLDAKILTNDFNLNKVAELQGISVLNVNDLANALKPVVLPGEEVEVHIIREGKEPDQGVGYLDDGTMIVVETGKRYIGETLTVIVTSVLQTSAGRMIFARPKQLAERAL